MGVNTAMNYGLAGAAYSRYGVAGGVRRGEVCVVRHDLAGFGAVRQVWRAEAWSGMVRQGEARRGTERQARRGMTWRGSVGKGGAW